MLETLQDITKEEIIDYNMLIPARHRNGLTEE